MCRESVFGVEVVNLLTVWSATVQMKDYAENVEKNMCKKIQYRAPEHNYLETLLLSFNELCNGEYNDRFFKP